MGKYYVIDHKNIQGHLSEKNKKEPDRTKGSLDLLLKNIDNNLLDVLTDDKIMIEVDDEKKEINLLGDNLPSEKWKVLFDKNVNIESIYNSVVRAIDVVKKIEWWEDLIKEIKIT